MRGGKIGHVFFSGWPADLTRDFFFGIHGSACLSRPRSSTNNVTPNNVNIPYYLMLSGNFSGSEIRHGSFGRLMFVQRIFFGFVGSRRDFLGFDFCPHSIIPVT